MNSNAPIPPDAKGVLPPPRAEKVSSSQQNNPKYGPVAAILVAIGAFFVSQIIVGAAIGLLPAITGWSSEKVAELLRDNVLAQFLMTLAVEAVLLFLLWLFIRSRKISLRAIGLARPEARDVGYAILGYIAYLAIFIAVSQLAKTILPGLDFNQEQEIGFSQSTAGVSLIIVFASLVILPPIAEEITFRGFLYTGLRNKLPKIIAAIITSVLFALGHLQLGSGNAPLWAAALDTFVLSMILVYLRDKTKSLWSPIYVHMIKNCLAFFVLFVFKTL